MAHVIRTDFSLESYLIPLHEAEQRAKTADTRCKNDVVRLSELIKTRADAGVRYVVVANLPDQIRELLTRNGYVIEILPDNQSLKISGW